MRALLLAMLALTLTGSTALAQEPQFEVASIKPSPPKRGQTFSIQPGGRLVATGAHARFLIECAYGLQPYEVAGLPRWAEQDLFDIQAKGPERQEPYGSSEVLSMLRHLLEERFGIQHHGESAVRDVFLLTREREDRPLSSNFRPSTAECEAVSRFDIGLVRGGVCGARASWPREDGTVVMTYRSRTLQEFADGLVKRAGRPVLDRTNISGRFDIDLVNGRELDLGTSLREQLGLRLVSAEAPIEVLVVDAIHPPTPD